MKTARKRILGTYSKCLRNFFFAVFFAFFIFSSCGLDNYYYLDAPLQSGHIASHTTEAPDEQYFSCITNEEAGNSDFFSNASEFTFLGTDFYYRIYNNISQCQSVNSRVSGMISSTTYTSATEYLISTAGYKNLKIHYGTIQPLIEAGASPDNRYVYIRITRGTTDDYEKAIRIGSSGIKSSVEGDPLLFGSTPVYPVRIIENKGFEFSNSDSANPVPKSGDEDFLYSSSPTEEGSYYVDMYAVSVGRDSSYTESYSQPYHMGTIKITVDD